ncbi:MAG: hypothetical protein IPP90_15945 [Gemmatimonadaceae bacterium]|nr:hypothetical protein [Gemmatimonadaceae bacterium]
MLLVGSALSATVAARPLLAQPLNNVAQEFEKLHFRSIGPATMSGRVADFAVYEANPAIYYVGTAHGGVWKTTSNGAMFTPLFQDQGLIAIGDVAVSQINPDLVWVGAGESNNRQSTSWGGGIYKSTDGGKTFALMGLANSKHINRIIIDPRNNDVVLVAATGPLFGPGGERGVYKTTDGGKTWKQVLKVDDDTGANDLAQSVTDPNTLFASTYQRRRTACCMNGGGPGSGLWKSIDGGDTWTRSRAAACPAVPWAASRSTSSAAAPRLVRGRRRAGRLAAGVRPAVARAPEGAAAGGRGGGGAGRHRGLSVRRRRHDVDQDERDQPAPDVLLATSHRPDVAGAGLPGRCRPAHVRRRRAHLRDRCRAGHARRRARDLDQPGQPQPHPHR